VSQKKSPQTPETTPTPANGEGEQRRGGGIWALVGRRAQRAARRQEHCRCSGAGRRKQ